MSQGEASSVPSIEMHIPRHYVLQILDVFYTHPPKGIGTVMTQSLVEAAGLGGYGPMINTVLIIK